MKAKIVVAIMSVSCLVGCDSKPQPAAKSDAAPPAPASPVSTNIVDIKKAIRLMCDTLGKQGESEEFYRQMGGFLRSATNVSDVATMIQVHDALRESLFDVDFSGLSYREQAKVFRKIQDLVWHNELLRMLNQNVLPRDLWVEKEVETDLKSLAWQRAVIKRLRPRHRVENPNVVLDIEADDERTAWQGMYYGGMGEYEGLMWHVEQFCHDRMRGLQPETVNRIKKSVEDYIGRPIRTREQLREDHMQKRPVEFLEKKDPHAAP